jgi:hypothetical protein
MTYDTWKATDITLDVTVANGLDYTDYLNSIPHRHLNLNVDSEGVCNRPRITLWPAANEDLAPAVVTMGLDPEIGQPRRYIDLTPAEARTLAQHLLTLAAIIETA